MAQLFSEGVVLQDSEQQPLAGVSDVEIIVYDDGSQVLVVASEAKSAITSYVISPSGEVTFADTVPYSADSGTQVVSDIIEVDRTDGTLLLVLGRYDDNYGMYSVDETGAMTFVAALEDTGDQFSQGLVGDSFQIGDNSFLVTANFGTPGAMVYRIDANGNVTQHQELEDTEWRRMGDVTVIHYAELQGNRMMFIGSEQDPGLHSFSVSGGGKLYLRDRAVPVDYDGFYGVTAMDSVQFGDRAFIVMASAQTDTLTVARVSAGYQMNFIYEAEDTLDTRFQGVQDVEIVESGDRTFVFAAGADDGITLFEMTYRGKLIYLDSIADDFDTTLKNVSSIDVYVEDEIAYLYAGSSEEGGVTQLVVDLSRSGEDIRGDAVVDTLTGTEFDDVIWGMGKSDTLYGGAGNDRLIDGRGRDHLTGGEGADIFEFTADGRSDFVYDFDPTEDRIDLTEFDVNHYDDITVGAREAGAAVLVGDEVIRLYNPEGGPYDMELFSEDNFIFL